MLTLLGVVLIEVLLSEADRWVLREIRRRLPAAQRIIRANDMVDDVVIGAAESGS